jgi:hypothetical protein
MAHREFVTWTTVATPYGNASWAVIDGVLKVRSAIGDKAKQLGGMPPETLARLLMLELANEDARYGVTCS